MPWSITGGNGAASGLVDAQTGLNGSGSERQHDRRPCRFGWWCLGVHCSGRVLGRTGIVTLTEDRSVKQGTPDTPTDLSEGISLTAGVLNLTATITDGTATIQSATIDLGKQVCFWTTVRALQR